MNPILNDLKLVVHRLMLMPGVSKVVAGSISKSPHAHRSGELKWVSKDVKGNSGLIRAYSDFGMQNLHVYATDLDKLSQSLVTAVKSRIAPETKKPSPLPADSKIEREANKQPIYPAVPSPMKAAEAVKDAGLTGKLVLVTPDIAINWLERNSRNRPLRENDVQRYAADMKAGRWLKGGGIVKFAKDGTIINGQHMLWAVIYAGVPIEVYVMNGLDPDVVMVEDDHAKRRLVDVLRIVNPGIVVTTVHTAVATLLRYSMAWNMNESATAGTTRGGLRLTRQQEMSFLEEHKESIDFSVRAYTSKGNRKGIAVAAVMTPLARAWHTIPHEKLQRFASVVCTGLVEDKSENAAVMLRNYLQSESVTAGTILAKQETYRRVERAMRAYIDGEHIKSLRAVTEEQFLLPGERKPKKK